jgi:hypothetical protein
VLSDNTALDNHNVGLSITDSPPFQSVADVMADGNSASGNHQAQELAWQLTDRTGHFLSESSVYRILKAADLITSPAFVVMT